MLRSSAMRIAVASKAQAVFVALAMGLPLVGCSGSSTTVNATEASAKPLSTCEKELAEKPDEAPTKTHYAKPSLELAHILPKAVDVPNPPAKISLGEVVAAPGYDAIEPPFTSTAIISWRRTPKDVVRGPANLMPAWNDTYASLDRISALQKKRVKGRRLKEDCKNERCKACYDDLVDDGAHEISSLREGLLGALQKLRADLKKANISDADGYLMWGSVLELDAVQRDDNDHEGPILMKEALVTFYRAAEAPGARPDVVAWARYGALYMANALGEDAAIPGVAARGKDLEAMFADAILAIPGPTTVKTEAAVRVAELRAPLHKLVPAKVLKEASMELTGDESADALALIERMWWARSAEAEGDPVTAIRVLMPAYANRNVMDIAPEANPVVGLALRDIGRDRGAALGLVDEEAFAAIAMEVATQATQFHDGDLERTAVGAIRREAPHTTQLPAALRSLSYASPPTPESASAGNELAALVKTDSGGHYVGDWADAMRKHEPPYSDDEMRTFIGMGSVYAPATEPSRDAEGKWRAQDLAQKCHAGSAEGVPLTLSFDGNAALTIVATGDDPNADWRVTPNGGSEEMSVRDCLMRLGPIVFRTFGGPVQYTFRPIRVVNPTPLPPTTGGVLEKRY